MNSSTPAPYALILIDLAVSMGVDRNELLQGSSLTETGAAGLGARVADEDFRTVVANALALTGDDALGLHLGQRLNLSAHAVLGQAFLTCRDLGEVIELLERYYHVLATDLDLHFDRGPALVRITASATDTGLPLRFGLECIAAAMRNTLSGLFGTKAPQLRYDFPYPAPAYASAYTDILGSDVHFDCPTAAWSFSSAYLSVPLPSSNPALRELYEAECARLLADLKESADLAAQTRRLLRKLEGQYPQMPQVARMLNVSARTYRRRLAEEGTSFQIILDTVRAEHATRLLRETRLPVASIAYRLGFNDPSNFRRALRRWTGQSPKDIRSGIETSSTAAESP
jgi:AraC-like DNA-binding protein